MKSILHAALYLLVGLLSGFGFAAYFSGSSPEPELPAHAVEGSTERRIERLEANLDAVVARNADLQLRVDRLDAMLEDSVSVPVSVPEPRSTGPDRMGVRGGGEPGDESFRATQSTEQRRRNRNRDRDLQSQLTDAGFSLADAQRIETRIEELRLEAMQSRYEAMRSGEPQAGLLAASRPGTAGLREELGDADYERFLEATGRSTSVAVTSVLASSAAQTADIRPGDEIRTYDGERIFDIRDLNRVLLEGEPGEPVLIDIVRGGQPMQVVIPRGPLGITSGSSRRAIR